MMKTYCKYIGVALLTFAPFIGCTKELPTTTPDTSYVPKTEIGKNWPETVLWWRICMQILFS